MLLLEAKKIYKTFGEGESAYTVLRGLDLSIAQGEVCALVGPSGCGKSTLLHLLGLLERQDAGEIRFAGIDVSSLSSAEADRVRNENMGFIYQFHHLLHEFTVIENVMMPLLINGVSRKEARARAYGVLESVCVAEQSQKMPAEISGGQRQRVAVARALVHKPKMVLADEPTGNLDEENADSVFEVFLNLSRSSDAGVLIVTHNMELAKKADRILYMVNGMVEMITDEISGSKGVKQRSRRGVSGAKGKAKSA